MSIATRKEREQNQRRELIIETARQLFEKKGFDLTTVEEIAAQAELGKGTIYSHFQSKEQIYVAVLEEGLDILNERLEQTLNHPSSALDVVYQMYDVFMEFNRERKGIVEAFFVQLDRQNLNFIRMEGFVGGLRSKAEGWVNLVAKALQFGVEQKEFRPIDVTKNAQLIVGMLIGLIIQKPDPASFDSYRDTLFAMVLGGIQNQK